MKKFINLAAVGLLLTACSSNEVVVNPEEQTGDGQRYLAISLVSNNTVSRGDDGTVDADANAEATTPAAVYEAGDEYAAVKDNGIAFFFFKADGSAFAVDGTKNYVQKDAVKAWATTATATIDNYIAVLENMKGDTPSQLVAVLNYPGTFDANSYSLTDLKDIILEANKGYEDVTVDGTTTRYFLMSNSVYANGTADVVATPLEAKNFALSATEAESVPVTVYVERVVAKITNDGTPTYKEVTFSDTPTYANGTAIGTVYAQIKGWNIFNTSVKTPLFKQVAGSDGDWWNDKANVRSYWAKPYSTAVDNLQTTSLSWTSMSENALTAKLYPYENTYSDFDTDGTTRLDHNVGVVYAVQLTTDEAGNNPLKLARWLSKYYTLDALREAVATYFSNSLFDANGEAITSDKIGFTRTAPDGVTLESYQVAINIEGTWYDRDGEVAEVAALIKKAPKAEVWKNGMCYYYTPILHTIAPQVDGKDVTPGIVRNHWYKLAVSSITGFGTPVFDAEESVDPTKPDDNTDDQQWYLDAKIAVQSWRVVTQSIDLQ